VSQDLPDAVRRVLDRGLDGGGELLLLAGRQLAEASGMPSWRDPTMRWRSAERSFSLRELASATMLARQPAEVWSYTLWRRGLAHSLSPNPAHLAAAALELSLASRFLFVTNATDGLHLRASVSPRRSLEIAGNLDWMRCAAACGAPPLRLPPALPIEWSRERRATPAELELLRCPACGGPARPHGLWYAEPPDPRVLPLDDAIAAACRAGLVLIVGAAGDGGLLRQLAGLAANREVPLVFVHPESSPLAAHAVRPPAGCFWPEAAARALPVLAQAVRAVVAPAR
jgi:NAD-dependent deacetylase